MIEQAIIPDLGSLSNDDSHAVIDDQPPPDPGAGMDLDAREVAGDLRIEPGQKPQMVLPQPMAHPVKDGGVNAGVKQKDLQPAPGRRVPGLIGPQGLSQPCQSDPSAIHTNILCL